MPRYDLVIFDLDGTLADTVPGIAHAVSATFERLGLPQPDPSEVQSKIGGGARALVVGLLGPGRAELTDQVLAEFSSYYNNHAELFTNLYPGVRQTLHQLRRTYHLALATAKTRPATLRVLDHESLTDQFDVIVTANEMRAPKPDPGCLKDILTELQTAPSLAVMVGDTMTDVECARRAGLDAWIVTYGYGYQAIKAAGWHGPEISQFSQLGALLAEQVGQAEQAEQAEQAQQAEQVEQAEPDRDS
ncbi:MAG: HAD family hydrolase [Bifidobacteriaceae bacterium]|jgi:phosphoglycolate phosphatase|nr:HAD family hydrolase [Bifidobacteriaceae bacterium]